MVGMRDEDLGAGGGAMMGVKLGKLMMQWGVAR